MPNKYWNYWTLETDGFGRQVWKFDIEQKIQLDWNSDEGKQFLKEMQDAFYFDKTNNANASDLVFRTQKLAGYVPQSVPTDFPKYTDEKVQTAAESLFKGIDFYKTLQTNDGHWAGDYGGPHFLLPGLVVTSYITKTPLPEPHQALIKAYILNHQNADGGWGLHIEDDSTMFGTVLQYISLRILGADKQDTQIVKARHWIQENGGAVGTPSWGKFYMAVLGVYEWEGCNSLMPEMWLLPRNAPMHPGKYWCHCRMVYLPMAYCFGHKIVGEITPLIEALREEIYTQPYEEIVWKKYRSYVIEKDRYTEESGILKGLNPFLNRYEKLAPKNVRGKALDFILDYVEAEDEHTNYINIGPVSKAINSLVIWHAYGKDSEKFKKHVDHWFDYLWVAEDGMKMSGYNGSQLWDTAFATQAILESNIGKYFPKTIQEAYKYIDNAQTQVEVREHKKYFRHDSVGGWPFSTNAHGWPISDCTSEGLRSAIACHDAGLVEEKITRKRLEQAADILLSYQNADGGWASYENMRSSSLLELLNPSEVFGDIMVDYSYTECSSASIQGLCTFRLHYPDYKSLEVQQAIDKGVDFILKKQRADGSWLGSWAVCFTYATWFGLEVLHAAEVDTYSTNKPHAAVEKACAFLVSKQNADGGWGESYKSSVLKEYIPHEKSQVVNTAWALLALMAVDYPDRSVIDKGIQLLRSRQQHNGDWLQEGISGVFNFNCMITYTSYRNVFPIWALARYEKKYGI